MSKMWSPLNQPSLSSALPVRSPRTWLPAAMGPRMGWPAKSAQAGVAEAKAAMTTAARRTMINLRSADMQFSFEKLSLFSKKGRVECDFEPGGRDVELGN